MTDHRAAPEQWQRVENSLPGTQKQHMCALACAVRELRARVEALEKRCEVQLMQLSDLQERHHRLTLQVGHLEHELDGDDDDEPQQYCLEALEPPEGNSKPTPNFSQIGSSLVERVAATLHAVTDTDPNVPPGEWAPEARAAIREVAAVAREQDQAAPEMVLTWGGVAQWLEHEIAQPTSQEGYEG